MKTKTIISLFAFLFLGVLFTACNKQNSAEQTPKSLTISEALDTCFTKIGEYKIFIDPNRDFSVAKFCANNENKLLTAAYVDELSLPRRKNFIKEIESLPGNNKIATGLKTIHIFRLKISTMTSENLGQFVINRGGFYLNFQDLALLYEQMYLTLPPYIWILGGDYKNDKHLPGLCLFDQYDTPTKVFMINTMQNEKNNPWKASGVAVAYFTK